jgi:hypothetical protein
MAGEIYRLRDKSGETEKITINVGFVDLGHIDLLVHEGDVIKEKSELIASGNWPEVPFRARKPDSEKRGGLKGSLQHWPGVYSPEFRSPTFFWGAD